MLDGATVGAATSVAPDLELAIRLPRPGGRKLLPSHRIRGWHHPGGLTAELRLLITSAPFRPSLRPVSTLEIIPAVIGRTAAATRRASGERLVAELQDERVVRLGDDDPVDRASRERKSLHDA